MKTKFFKTVMPVAAVMLAIAGAFAAQSDKAAKPLVTGWVNLSASQPCFTSVQCKTEDGPICTLMYNNVSYQAFGIHPTTLQCSVRVNRIN